MKQRNVLYFTYCCISMPSLEEPFGVFTDTVNPEGGRPSERLNVLLLVFRPPISPEPIEHYCREKFPFTLLYLRGEVA